MNKGSKRVTIRVGNELLGLIKEDVEVHKEANNCDVFNVTDWIIKAITDKLSHRHRSRNTGLVTRAVKVSEYLPRKVTEE